MNLQKLIGKPAVGQICRLQVRYTWISPYVTVGDGSYSSISENYINFNGNISFQNIGAFNLSMKILNSREYEMNMSGNYL